MIQSPLVSLAVMYNTYDQLAVLDSYVGEFRGLN